jgi:hypothetical protein
MITVYAIHAPEAGKLEKVKAEMLQLGAPAIQVVECGDCYIALEGSHRLAAAHELGLTPRLIIKDQHDIVDVRVYDWYEPANWSGIEYLASEVVGEIFSARRAVPYSFEGVRESY